MTWRAMQPSIQHCSSLEIPSPRTGSMPSSRTLSKACLSASRLPNRLSFELAESNIRNFGGAFDIFEPADRLIQHNGNGGYFRDTGVRVPIVGMAWLFEQLDAGGIEG